MLVVAQGKLSILRILVRDQGPFVWFDIFLWCPRYVISNMMNCILVYMVFGHVVRKLGQFLVV